MNQNFTIDQVSWHTMSPGNPEARAAIIKRFYLVVKFLQENSLTVRILAESENDIHEEFAINSSDLNEQGLAVMRATYDKWLSKVDKGMDPSDITLFKKSFEKIKS